MYNLVILKNKKENYLFYSLHFYDNPNNRSSSKLFLHTEFAQRYSYLIFTIFVQEYIGNEGRYSHSYKYREIKKY